MKKLLVLTAIAAAAFSANAQVTSYPGSNWSEITVNPGVIRGTPEENNVLLQGNIEQGAIVGRVGDFRVNTFVGLNYSVDRNALSYNNKLVPMLGVKLQRDFSSSGVMDTGIRVVHENHFRGVETGPHSGTGVQLFFSYWTGWNLKK